MLPGRGKGRWNTRYTIPALAAAFPIRAPFVPDWWRVSLPDAISSVITIYPSSTGGMGGTPLTGTGQWAFPGEGETDSGILVDNPGPLAITLLVYASVGYPPDSYVPPVTVAVPTTINFKQQQYQVSTAVVSSMVVPFIQFGSQTIVIVSAYNGNAGVVPLATSVTIAGKTGTLLRQDSNAGDGSRGGCATSVWEVVGLTSGASLTATVTLNNLANAQGFNVWVFCTDAGIGFGAVGGANQNPAGGAMSFSFNVVATRPSSIVVAIGFKTGGVVINETGGAEKLDEKDYALNSSELNRRAGSATQTFVYQAGADFFATGCGSGVEAFIQ